MATIGGLTTSTSTSIRGYGGLASGLDRDTLIEGMTSGTTSKITQQQKKQQQLEWKQAAIQNITSKLLDFANKYTSSWSSSTNLFSSILWGRNKITTTGENSKYVSVSGSGTSAEGVTIMGVKQLAQKAKWSSAANVSGQTLSTGSIDVTKTYDIEQLIGKELNFKIGNEGSAQTYTLTLKEQEKLEDGTIEKYDYSTVEKAKESINKQLARIETTLGKLSEVVQVNLNPPETSTVSPGTERKFEFTASNKGTDNHFEITGGSALKYLGFSEELKHTFTNSDRSVTATNKSELIDHVSIDRLLNGKKLTFSYNGKTAEISMPSEAELKEAMNGVDSTSDWGKKKTSTEAVLNKIVTSVQDQLDEAFGKGRIKVDKTAVQEVMDKDDPTKVIGLSGGQLTFKTMNPKDDSVDNTSTLKIVSINSDIKYALGLQDGMSNRVNMNEQLKNRLDNAAWTWKDVEDDKGNVVMGTDNKPLQRGHTSIKINGHDIDVYSDDTMNSLINRINNTKEAGVKITYQEAADKFTFTATEDGASGEINIEKDSTLEKLFGIKEDIEKEGQDAIVAVKYAGSDEAVELIRGSNSFTVDGLTINVKGTFGYEGDDLIKNDPSKAVGIDAQVDADSIVDAVKGMIEEYNSIIELVNKEVKTKPDRDYEPLTSEQKKELSDDEIEAWEKKAKEGLLYADSDIRSLTSDLRFIIDGGIAQELAEMGISTSSTYSDNGKINFDESKFRAALASKPERVQEIFANESVKNTNGNGYSKGVATNLKNVLNKYVNTTGAMTSKGILIRKAGHESSPMSVTENTMYSQLKAIKDQIAKLQERLETERDRYIKQFTSLETLISQMNNQSSWLSQFGGY